MFNVHRQLIFAVSIMALMKLFCSDFALHLPWKITLPFTYTLTKLAAQAPPHCKTPLFIRAVILETDRLTFFEHFHSCMLGLQVKKIFANHKKLFMG